MPTNILRHASRKAASSPPGPVTATVRDILISTGSVRLRARLAPTATGERLWAALPLHSRAETWGRSVKVKVPIESGRERGAKLLGQIGEIYYLAEDDRIMIVFGPTPISMSGEIRLPRPCNLLATTTDEVSALAAVVPGQKISILRAEGG